MRTVLITGIFGGIGKATAQLFSEQGWRVIGTDTKIDRNHDDEISRFKFDAADPDESSRFFAKLQDEGTFISALVNNAAVQLSKALVETNLEEWDKVLANNLRSTYLMVRNSYPLMKDSGGAIVNVSSVHAMASSANIAAYAASKGALVSLTRALSIELAVDNIRVNAVLPGAVDTKMLRAGLYRRHPGSSGIDVSLQELASRHVLGRIGTPREIAEGILFLADGNKSSFITGQTLVIDGGALAKLSTA